MANFPKELNLGSNKPMGALGKPSINRYRADNSSYGGGDTIRIEIPCGRNGQYIFPQDSFIEGRLSVNYTTTAAVGTPVGANIYIDQSVYALFNRMRIIHGSIAVEDTLYDNRLWTALYDLQVNEVERRGDTITKLVYDNTTYTAFQAVGGLVYNSHLTGSLLKSGANSAETANTKLFDFSFTIPSGVIGSLCSKALPVGLMGASSLYIELELAPVNVAFVGTNPTGSTSSGLLTLNSYAVQDVYYNAKLVTLPSDVHNALVESTQGYINIPAVSYKTEMKTIGSAAAAFNDKFSFQFSSIKTFLFWFTNTATAQGGTLVRSISSRPKCYLTDYFLLVNGEAYPSQSIGYGSTATSTVSNNSARMYAELQRSFDYLTDTNAGGIINYANYSIDDPSGNEMLGSFGASDPGAITVQKRFIGGIDLDRFNHSSDILMSGTSTIGQMINLNLGFSQAIGTGVNVYGAVMYDVLYHIKGGQLQAKF